MRNGAQSFCNRFGISQRIGSTSAPAHQLPQFLSLASIAVANALAATSTSAAQPHSSRAQCSRRITTLSRTPSRRYSAPRKSTSLHCNTPSRRTTSPTTFRCRLLCTLAMAKRTTTLTPKPSKKAKKHLSTKAVEITEPQRTDDNDQTDEKPIHSEDGAENSCSNKEAMATIRSHKVCHV